MALFLELFLLACTIGYAVHVNLKYYLWGNVVALLLIGVFFAGVFVAIDSVFEIGVYRAFGYIFTFGGVFLLVGSLVSEYLEEGVKKLYFFLGGK